MTKEIAEEIFRLAIETTNLENRKWEIRKMFKDRWDCSMTWEEVCTLAMREKMGMTADQIIEEARR